MPNYYIYIQIAFTRSFHRQYAAHSNRYSDMSNRI